MAGDDGDRNADRRANNHFLRPFTTTLHRRHIERRRQELINLEVKLLRWWTAHCSMPSCPRRKLNLTTVDRESSDACCRMRNLVRLIVWMVADPFRSWAALEAEFYDVAAADKRSAANRP